MFNDFEKVLLLTSEHLTETDLLDLKGIFAANEHNGELEKSKAEQLFRMLGLDFQEENVVLPNAVNELEFLQFAAKILDGSLLKPRGEDRLLYNMLDPHKHGFVDKNSLCGFLVFSDSISKSDLQNVGQFCSAISTTGDTDGFSSTEFLKFMQRENKAK